MPTQDGFMTEAELDRAAIERRGGTVPDKPLSAEEREKQRQQSADRRNAAAQNEPDRKVGAERFKIAKAALLGEVQRMKHGQVVTDSEKKRIAAGIIDALGENTPDSVKAQARRYVDVAAQAYRDGAPGPVWSLAEEAATAIANADFDIGPAPVEDSTELDPRKLADMIRGR